MNSLLSILPWLGATLVGIISFFGGKAYAQSEKILDQKRRAYEEFLKECPAPNEAHGNESIDFTRMQRLLGVLSIYGSEDSLKFAGAYLADFGAATTVLSKVEQAGHPRFLELLSHYNRMVWAMRNDAMMWSVFAPSKKAREYRTSLKF